MTQVKDNILFNNKWIIAYYVVLSVLLFSMMRPGVDLPMTRRIVLMGLIFIPTLFVKDILPAIAVFFLGIDIGGFTAFLPSNDLIVFAIILVLYIYNQGIAGTKRYSILPICLAYLSYFVLLSLFHADIRPKIIWVVIAFLLGDMIKSKKNLMLVFYMFMLLSIFLGLLFVAHRGEFAVSYGSEELERSFWINPNVFGAEISAGGVLAFAYLMGVLEFEKNKFAKILSIITVAFAFFTLVINASRGAILAFALPVLVLVMTSKTKMTIKVLIILVGSVFILWLFNSGYFDLLLYRIEADETGGTGGRMGIWSVKLNAFFIEGNPLSLLLGIGQEGCVNIGTYKSTHNDFVTAFIAYGLLGLFLFIYVIFIYPYKKAGRRMRILVLSLLSYLIVECCVLEPFFRFYIVELMFYFFILRYVLIMRKDNGGTMLESR